MTQENTTPGGTTRLPDSGQTPSVTTRLPDSGQTGTMRIADTNKPGVPSGITNHEAQTNFIGGGLFKNEEIEGFKVISKIQKTTGEAEIYIAEKEGKKAVLKYYYQSFKPKSEILNDLLNLNHENIINVCGFGTYKERFYEIQDYASGGTLGDKKEDENYKYAPITEENAIEIVKETIEAFNCFHNKGIIHRDIKPDNIFFKNADGSAVLIGDFGISSALDIEGKMTKRITSTFAMTYGYAAPELFGFLDKTDKKMKLLVGPEVDYYALGITLYVALAAEDPFEDRPTGHIMRDTAEGRVVDDLLTREKGKNISPKLKKLIRGLLVVRHDKRWKYEDVKRHLNGEEVDVYAEQIQTQIPPFVFSENYTINSLNELAKAITEDKDAGRKFLYRGMLDEWLRKFNQALANKVIDLKENYGSADAQMYGLERLRYALDPSLSFEFNDKKKINNLKDFDNSLKERPGEIIKYLRNENSELYAWFEENRLDELSEKIKDISSKMKSDKKLINTIRLSLMGESFKPFEATEYGETVLSNPSQLWNLPEDYRSFILQYMEDDESLFCVWLRNSFEDTLLNRWFSGAITHNWANFQAVFTGTSIRNFNLSIPQLKKLSSTGDKEAINLINYNIVAITIGTQEWMAENLNDENYRNGDIIPQVQDSNQWKNLKTGAWCYYENKADNGNKYGKLYNWYAVNDPRGLAPKVWHIPSDAEWTQLTNFLGGEKVAGGKLKATTLWDSPNTGATNESGFTAFPGGYRNANGGYDGIGKNGTFWSASEFGSSGAWGRVLGYYISDYRHYGLKKDGFSIRCVRDLIVSKRNIGLQSNANHTDNKDPVYANHTDNKDPVYANHTDNKDPVYNEFEEKVLKSFKYYNNRSKTIKYFRNACGLNESDATKWVDYVIGKYNL